MFREPVREAFDVARVENNLRTANTVPGPQTTNRNLKVSFSANNLQASSITFGSNSVRRLPGQNAVIARSVGNIDWGGDNRKFIGQRGALNVPPHSAMIAQPQQKGNYGKQNCTFVQGAYAPITIQIRDAYVQAQGISKTRKNNEEIKKQTKLGKLMRECEQILWRMKRCITQIPLNRRY